MVDKKPSAGLPIGAPAPAFAFESTDGRRRSVDEAVALGLPVLLLFFTPGCSPCARIATELPMWRQRLDATVTFLIVGGAT